MPDISSATDDREHCLDIALRAEASFLRATGGKEIPFVRAILIIRNICASELVSVELHATLGQEGGTVQDVSTVFSQSPPAVILPGSTLSWDVYDQLIPAHPGTAGKVHMFGYRAALNWRFDLAAWAEYRPSGSSTAVQTPVSRWTLKWSVSAPVSGNVELTIEDLKT